MFGTWILRLSRALLYAGLAVVSLHAGAQGGPPMLTDDPGTPGDGHWEINIATLSDHSGDTWTYALPMLDLNYGAGDRLQLKFELPWAIEHVDGHSRRSGAGNSLAGVKWRFYDAGEDGWQVSTYPQVRTRFPVSGSPLADGGVAYLLPLEVQRKFADWGVNLEFGRWLRPPGEGDSWINGVAIGRDLSKNLELIGELHNEADVHSGRSALTLNFGARWRLSEHYTLLVSAGTDLHNSLEEESALLTYLGLQVNL
jgi:hypothetical protein